MAARRKVGDLRWHIPFRCLARPGEEAAHAGRRPGGNCRPPLLPVAHVPEHPLVAARDAEVLARAGSLGGLEPGAKPVGDVEHLLHDRAELVAAVGSDPLLVPRIGRTTSY